MTAAAELREAAARMRQAAAECGVFGSPWRFEQRGARWPLVGQLCVDVDDPHGLIADFWPSDGCGPYVASMHPGVALAVADLLDVAARTADLVRSPDGWFPPFTTAALAVARAYLPSPMTDREVTP